MQGQIYDILRPQLAMNRFLPLWPHRFPHFGYLHLGGGGVGGSDIRSMSSIRPICKCRCPPLLASFFLNFESKEKFEFFPPKSSLLPRFLMTAANNYRLILCKPPPPFCFCFYTDKKENQIFLIYSIRSGAVAKTYMTNGLLIYREIFSLFLIY